MTDIQQLVELAQKHNCPLLWGQKEEVRKTLLNYEKIKRQQRLWVCIASLILITIMTLSLVGDMFGYRESWVWDLWAILFLCFSFPAIKVSLLATRFEEVGKLLPILKKVERWSGLSLEQLALLRQKEVRSLMSTLMEEVCGKVLELQDGDGCNLSTERWKWELRLREDAVNTRFNTLKVLGYMPKNGYGVFYRRVKNKRSA
ncbi:hypothetical protein KTR10_00920 [Candidatus Kaiserbacteria bacterium]|nr:hypothetical protein [Candidatus Kaiserbacteria bacterium]